MNEKVSQEVNFVKLIGHEKFGQKQKDGFQISPKKLVNLFAAGERVYFLGSDLEITIQFLTKLFIALQCHKMKFL